MNDGQSGPMTRIVIAGVVTAGLILWAHQLATIGGRVPMVYVALWFGSAAMVALVFSGPAGARTPAMTGAQLWRARMRLAALCLSPLALTPLLERHGVSNDPAVWLLDCALIISLATVPYFTLVARTAFGGTVLSIGAFQALWTAGASVMFVIMEHLERGQGRVLTRRASFEAFFRLDYRYLFYILCGVMLLGYCPAILALGRRRFVRQHASPGEHLA